MKTKILTKLTAMLIQDGKVIADGQLSKSLRTFSFGIPFTNLSKTLSIREISDKGSVVVAYIFDSDYNPRLFNLEPGEPLVITDYFDKKPFKIRLECEFLDVEVDENKLQLLVSESASDSCGAYYRNGEDKSVVPVKEGTIFTSKLLLKDNQKILIEKVDGLSVTLNIDGTTHTIDPFHYYFTSSSGCANSRYDVDSWERYFSIEIDIPNSIKMAIH